MIRVLRLAVAAVVLAGGLAAAPAATAATGHPPFTQITAGDAHACALTSAGTVWCWGWDGHNQLGDGTNWSSSLPLPVPGLSGVRQVDAGGEFTCAVLDTGAVKCWGNGGSGQLGDGLSHESATPVTAVGVSHAVQVKGGGGFACALLDSAQVMCWGRNDLGQLGRGTVDGSGLPTLPGLVSYLGAGSLAVGTAHACVVGWSADVVCWGQDDSGQTGATATATQPTPTSITGVYYATGVDAGGGFTCARMADSSLRCWGAGGLGQLGNNALGNSAAMVTPNGMIGTTGLALGTTHACGLFVDGAAACWGDNSAMALGAGDRCDLFCTQSKVPVSVEPGQHFIQLAAGTHFTCGIDGTGAAFCWGAPASGQTAGGANLAGGLIPMFGTPQAIAWDTKAPAASALTVVPLVGWTLSGTAVPVAVGAQVTDPLGDDPNVTGSGPGACRVARSLNGGGWTTTTSVFPGSLPVATGTGVSAPIAALAFAPTSGTTRYRVTPVDRAGNAGVPITGTTLSVRLAQNTDTAIRVAGTWGTQTAASFSGGSARYSTKAGSSASYTFTGRSIALVTTVAPNRGAARIYVDGVLKATVDAMQPASATYRQVTWQKTWAVSGTHTIKVVVLGTPGRPRFDIDAFVVVK